MVNEALLSTEEKHEGEASSSNLDPNTEISMELTTEHDSSSIAATISISPSKTLISSQTAKENIFPFQLKNQRRRTSLRRYLNKGDISNLISFMVMITGIYFTTSPAHKHKLWPAYILAAGLFGYAGGITNWLAVKMLFDKIPLMYGSGVIPRQFKEIRQTVKETILETFFDEEFLEGYIKERSHALLMKLDLEKRIETYLDGPSADRMLTAKLAELSAKPEGVMLNSFAGMFGGIEPMVPMIKPMLLLFAAELTHMLHENFNPLEFMSVEAVHEELNKVMTTKLEELTPEIVKELMEHVIREHLGWLIVWGNIFGGLIGVISLAAGYGAPSHSAVV